jgi:molybdate transport system substrate-binding protein
VSNSFENILSVFRSIAFAIGASTVFSFGFAQAADVRIFAAASTATAVQELARKFEDTFPGQRIRASFAASSVLAKQIVNAAPADIFLSASRQWMKYVVAENAVDKGSVVDLLSNRLTLIAPKDANWTIEIAPDFDILSILDGGYLAIGDPDHVPAGIYARQALEGLGVWPKLSGRIARAANVRAALVLVERAEVSAGIVYATDAAISDKIVVKGEFPPVYHDCIVYPVALVRTEPPIAVRRFFDFLSSDYAHRIWKSNGFELVNSGSWY